MSFRQATGREVCNRCRRVINEGAACYYGELTPGRWCLECAADTLGKTPDGNIPKYAPVDHEMARMDVRLMAAKLLDGVRGKR